ncbi:MAG: glycoside hydrolase family 18 protein [Terracidiphilus sp.]
MDVLRGIGLLMLGAAFVLPAICAAAPARPVPTRLVVAGYVFPDGAALKPGEIDPSKLTRINYAFANIRNGQIVLGFPQDAPNLAVLTALRRQNPALAVLVSVGGWSWSAGFSDAALTAASRASFAESAVEFIDRYDLDGLDVDWEYPGQPGAGHAYRKQDKQNFTLLLEELRERLDRESARTHRRLYLTIAAAASEEYLDHTEMAAVARYVDDVNLMAYDYYIPGAGRITGNLAPLFVSPRDPKQESANRSVLAFEQAGVPAEKIVLGVPFYGRAWGNVEDANHGLFERGQPAPHADVTYGAIAQTMLGHGFARYWDSAASVPYLYSAGQRIFVSYEDPESLTAKCSYVLKQKLAGVFFWQYSDDSEGTLLDAIDKGLRLTKAGGASAVQRNP